MSTLSPSSAHPQPDGTAEARTHIHAQHHGEKEKENHAAETHLTNIARQRRLLCSSRASAQTHTVTKRGRSSIAHNKRAGASGRARRRCPSSSPLGSTIQQIDCLSPSRRRTRVLVCLRRVCADIARSCTLSMIPRSHRRRCRKRTCQRAAPLQATQSP